MFSTSLLEMPSSSTFAASSASAFLADTTAFLGERRRGGSGVAEAFALPLTLPFFGDGVLFAFAMARTTNFVRFCLIMLKEEDQ